MERTIPEAPNSPKKATDCSIAEENKKCLQFIEEVTANVDEVQKRVLAEILSGNANVEYLQRHDLNDHTDRETFKKVIPVITYKDIQPDINRIANGDNSPIFCSQPISEFLTSNDLPLVSAMYASSECPFGINLNPFCKPSEVSYTLIPAMCYFEFSPIHRDNGIINSISMSKSLNEKEKTQLVDLVDVKIGQEYELVVTTYSGLYRYKVGDMLRVAGYKNNTPQFYFVCQQNVILSIDSDKTDEAEIQNAVHNLIPFDANVTEYTSYADTATIPGHYVQFWELSVNGSTQIPHSVFEDCCLTIEESLNSVYHQEIRLVEIGTFDKLMDYCVSLGASLDQYKTPRCVKFAHLVELLNSRVMSSHFSPTCPNWVPGHKQWNNMN